MDFQQSRTYANLLASYEHELKNSAQYEIYADIARNETYIEIANIYEVTARNDKEHARIWLRQMNQGILPTTEETLRNSAQIETETASNMYQEYARIAREEGFNDIAALFSGVANIDFNHSTEFMNQYEEVISNEVFCKPFNTLWICMQCGNIMSAECAPIICPVCGFPQGYYRLYENQ